MPDRRPKRSQRSKEPAPPRKLMFVLSADFGNLSDALRIGDIELSPFTRADTRALYTIRNHPSVRRYMTNPVSIPYRLHVAWVKAHPLDRHDHHLFIVRVRGHRRLAAAAGRRRDGVRIDVP